MPSLCQAQTQFFGGKVIFSGGDKFGCSYLRYYAYRKMIGVKMVSVKFLGQRTHLGAAAPGYVRALCPVRRRTTTRRSCVWWRHSRTRAWWQWVGTRCSWRRRAVSAVIGSCSTVTGSSHGSCGWPSDSDVSSTSTQSSTFVVCSTSVGRSPTTAVTAQLTPPAAPGFASYWDSIRTSTRSVKPQIIDLFFLDQELIS